MGNFSAVIVLYDFTAIRGATYTVSWPADWEITQFVSCADLTIGADITQNPMDVAGAWTNAVVSAGGTGGIPLGILRGTATSPGVIRILGSEAGHTLQVVDALIDPGECVLKGRDVGLSFEEVR